MLLRINIQETTPIAFNFLSIKHFDFLLIPLLSKHKTEFIIICFLASLFSAGIDFGDAVTNVVAELSEIKCKIDEEQGKNITRVKSDQSESEILLQYWQRNTHRISSLFRHTILDKKTGNHSPHLLQLEGIKNMVISSRDA